MLKETIITTIVKIIDIHSDEGVMYIDFITDEKDYYTGDLIERSFTSKFDMTKKKKKDHFYRIINPYLLKDLRGKENYCNLLNNEFIAVINIVKYPNDYTYYNITSLVSIKDIKGGLELCH